MSQVGKAGAAPWALRLGWMSGAVAMPVVLGGGFNFGLSGGHARLLQNSTIGFMGMMRTRPRRGRAGR